MAGSACSALTGIQSPEGVAVLTRRILTVLSTALLLSVFAACATPQGALPRSPSRPYAPAPSLTPSPRAALATPASVASGPLGTLTAIAAFFPTATPEPPYEIVNRGRPHFIEFHAWW